MAIRSSPLCAKPFQFSRFLPIKPRFCAVLPATLLPASPLRRNSTRSSKSSGGSRNLHLADCMNSISLPGCTSEPLINYLKGLGILRLISEDAKHGDPHARGAWKNGAFVLHTKLTPDEL